MILKMLQLKEELLYINAGGDGLDSNGDVVMTGGTIVIDGPEDSADGAIDYDSSFDMSGGEIIAAGSSGMAMTPSSTSAINSVNITFSTTYSNTEIIIKDSNGNEIVSYTPVKKFNSFVFGSENLKTGETYTVYAGGEEIDSFTVSGTITNVGNGGSFGGGFQGGKNMGGDRR